MNEIIKSVSLTLWMNHDLIGGDFWMNHDFIGGDSVGISTNSTSEIVL